MHRYKFDSVRELIEAGQKPCLNYANREHQEHGINGWVCADRPHVTGQASALRELENPLFPKGAERVEALQKTVTVPAMINTRRVAVRAEQGDELDMQRVWNGELDTAWRAMRRGSRVGPCRVLIAVNCLTNSGSNSSVLAWRGVAALALANALREAGHSVQISAVCDTVLRNRAATRYVAEVTVLEAGQEFDLHKLASLMASGLLLRGVLFAHMAQVEASTIHMGLCAGITELKRDSFDATGFDYVAVCENMEARDEAGALAWINRHVAAIDARTMGEAA